MLCHIYKYIWYTIVKNIDNRQSKWLACVAGIFLGVIFFLDSCLYSHVQGQTKIMMEGWVSHYLLLLPPPPWFSGLTLVKLFFCISYYNSPPPPQKHNSNKIKCQLCRLRVFSIYQNWPAGPLLDQLLWQWNRLFPRVFAEKPSPFCIIFRIWLM